MIANPGIIINKTLQYITFGKDYSVKHLYACNSSSNLIPDESDCYLYRILKAYEQSLELLSLFNHQNTPIIKRLHHVYVEVHSLQDNAAEFITHHKLNFNYIAMISWTKIIARYTK